jgi:hypothetical protein
MPNPYSDLYWEFYSRIEYFIPPFTFPKQTVVEKVKQMWERSAYYKKQKMKEQVVLMSKKLKPYYRRHERW